MGMFMNTHDVQAHLTYKFKDGSQSLMMFSALRTPRFKMSVTPFTPLLDEQFEDVYDDLSYFISEDSGVRIPQYSEEKKVSFFLNTFYGNLKISLSPSGLHIVGEHYNDKNEALFWEAIKIFTELGSE